MQHPGDQQARSGCVHRPPGSPAGFEEGQQQQGERHVLRKIAVDTDRALEFRTLASSEADLETDTVLGNAITQDDIENREQAGVDGGNPDGHGALLE